MNRLGVKMKRLLKFFARISLQVIPSFLVADTLMAATNAGAAASVVSSTANGG